MSYNFFRHSPVYENALRTPDVLERPQSPTAFFRRNREPLEDYQVKGAGYRLDHLIRNALNPRFTIYRAVAEPLLNAGIDKAEHMDRVAAAFRRVHLPDLDRYLDKYPHQLSGGQLQRVVLARALVLTPRFLVADEPVSMLDVSVRAGILALMREVRDTLGLSAVYISHDLALVRYLCERTLVMYLGRIVEDAPTDEIVRRPRHPYTQALVAAVPVPDADQSRAPLPIKGNVPDAREPPSGCSFRDRCPRAMARCAEETPLLRRTADGHRVACHLDLA